MSVVAMANRSGATAENSLAGGGWRCGMNGNATMVNCDADDDDNESNEDDIKDSGKKK
jgi:hypothetical protein